MTCAICEKRKAKRSCPAKGAAICAPCCGKHREVTLTCPLDCRYLQEARVHEFESREVRHPFEMPFREIPVDWDVLEAHGVLLSEIATAVLDSALSMEGATDRDAQAALESAVQTYKTMQSGVFYEARPDSMYARRIAEAIYEAIDKFRKEESEGAGFPRTKDGDVLQVVVFLFRMALDRDNLRPRGREFLQFLRDHFSRPAEAEQRSPLVLPGY